MENQRVTDNMVCTRHIKVGAFHYDGRSRIISLLRLFNGRLGMQRPIWLGWGNGIRLWVILGHRSFLLRNAQSHRHTYGSRARDVLDAPQAVPSHPPLSGRSYAPRENSVHRDEPLPPAVL